MSVVRALAPVLAWSVMMLPLPARAAPAPVEVTEVAREPIVERVRVTGTLVSPRAASLSPAVDGLIDHYAVEAGDRVSEGDELLTLDTELEAHSLARSRAEVDRVKANLGDARRQLAEAQRLAQQADIAETEVESRRAAVAALEAALASAQAEADLQQAIVRRHSVRAPFDGVIAARTAELGEWVGPGDTLLELVAIGDLWFDFQAPQHLYPRVALDTPVTLSVDALPDNSPLDGHVVAIVPVKEPGARTFLLRAVAVDGGDLPITPGMSARAVLHLDTGRQAVAVPRDAVIRYPDGRTTVWTVEDADDGIVAQEQVVEIGLEFDGNVEIRAGLEPGARVVTRGNEALQPNQQVRVE